MTITPPALLFRCPPFSGLGFAVVLTCAVASLALAKTPEVPQTLVALPSAPAAEALSVTNNHAFPVREMLSIPVAADSADAAWLVEEFRAKRSTGIRALQLHREGTRVYAWLDVALEGGASADFSFRPDRATSATPPAVTEAEMFPSGLPKAFRTDAGVELPAFDLLLVESTTALEKFQDAREKEVRAALAESAGQSQLRFRRTAAHVGPMLAEFRYEADGGRFNDYKLSIVHRVHASGALDTEITVGTSRLRTRESYLAVAKLLPGTSGASVVIDWKGEKHALQTGSAAPQRTLRSHNWGRDLNWVALGRETGGSLTRPLIAAYVPNLARVQRDTLRNANDFLVNEYALGTADGWAVLAEIGREQLVVKSYVAMNFVPPSESETVTLRYRTLPPGNYAAPQVDNALVSFAGYQGARVASPGKLTIDLGVAGVSFGTNYFPNATFGENFEFWRSAGLSGGRLGRDYNYWWPSFRHWELFKDDIRRDLRILNSLGIEWFRIHDYVVPDYRQDYLQTPEGAWMFEYLKFMAQTARECGLGILHDFHISPGDAAFVARNLGDVIKFYEIDNEVLLIPGAKTEYFDYWREVRERIRQERPGAPVFVTGAAAQPFALHQEFDRRGLTFDAIGQHSYVDRREAPAHFRDDAVSLGGFATGRGQMPINTEYNWRMITRETEAQQAQHFGEISDHYLGPRAMPVAFQFQFQETFCIPPRNRGALRHYEPLRWDRTPKPQAFVFKDSIRKYGTVSNRLRQLALAIEGADQDGLRVSPGQEFTYTITARNVAARPLSLTLTPRLPTGLVSTEPEVSFELQPGEHRVITRRGRADAKLAPGVYHFFEEARFDDGDVHFGWGIARFARQPQLDLTQPLLKGVRYEGGVEMLAQIDLSAVASSVFGEDAPALEVDWALYLYHTLRSATGSPVTREKDTTLSPAGGASRNLVVVGTPSSNALVRAIAAQLPPAFMTLAPGEGYVVRVDAPLGNAGTSWLVLTGGDAEGVERAASDFLYRYWRFAKDSVTFRNGMPPMEGSWTGGEPERAAPSASASARETALQSLSLQMPKSIRVGESFRVVALSTAEPPGPAVRVRISVYRGKKRVQTGVSNAAGEVVFQLEETGSYEVRADRVPASATTIKVTK
jgi:hypothetical protein